MYRILCFGDSNTWGYNPVSGLRFSEKERWPGVLRSELGDGFIVTEDGRNGRMFLEGASEFSSSLRENTPLDVIIIYLGINDICFEQDSSVDRITEAADAMIAEAGKLFIELGDAAPDIILIGAPPINKEQVRDCLYELEAGKVLRLVDELRDLAGRRGCGFIDSGRLIETSSVDGIHLEAPAHLTLGQFVADYTRSFLKNTNLNSNRR